MNLTLTIPESEQPPITVTVGGTTELTSYVAQVAGLPDYPATFPPAIGSAGNQAVAGNDPRLTNSRTPTAHTHPLADLTGVTPAAIGAMANTNAAVNAAMAQSPGTSRTALELGTAATYATADLPVSTAAQTALDGKQPSIVPKTARFVFEGDSITNPNLVAYPTQTSWVPHALTLPNFAGRGTASNVAVSGSTYNTMIARYTASVYPLRPTGGETVYLFVMIGSNDTGTAPDAWIAAMESYWAQAKTDGFRVVAITPPVSTVSNVQRLAAKVRGSLIPDLIVDLGEHLDSPYKAETFLGDYLHPTAKGAAIIGQAVDSILSTSRSNATAKPYFVGDGKIGVGTNDPLSPFHSISTITQLRVGSNQTPNTAKSFALGMESYDSSASPTVDFMGGLSASSYNYVYVGRGGSANRAATDIQFWVGSSATATAASSVMVGKVNLVTWTLGDLASGGGGISIPLSINDASAGLSFSSTSAATSKQSTLFVRVPSAGSFALNSLSGETIIAPPSDKSIAFATTVGESNFQDVRVRIKASGVINTTSAAIPNYADDTAADAALSSGDLYTTTAGGRTVYRKP